MAVSVQSFTQFVENQVAAIQGYCATLLDFTVGSILRAFVEATAAMGLFLEAVALQVAALTRAQTSNGPDLDSFYAQFNFTRLAATVSSGNVTFSRFTNTAQALIPVGTIVQSFDGSQQFQVVADTTNAAYSVAQNGFIIVAGTSSLTVAAQSLTAATTANVAAGTITQIVNAVQYVDTVTNASSFVGGTNAETDAAYRARFVLYIASLSKATKAAVQYAISLVPDVSSYTLIENQAIGGATQYGYFYVVVDNGTGSPSSGFLASIYSAIDSVRPLGTYFSVIAPTTVTANIAMTLTTAAGYVHSTVTAAVQIAISQYVSSLGIGATLPYSRLSQIAYDASPGVLNVTAVTINSGTSDVTATSQQEVIASSVVVS
jgi:uncharacterized phage protein gp47/JayE